MEKKDGYKEYSSIEEYIEAEGITDKAAPIFACGLRKVDAERRKKFRPKRCPANHFEECIFDDCALFDNDKPGLPWWGVCRLGRWPVGE